MAHGTATSALIQSCLPINCQKLDNLAFLHDSSKADISPFGIRQISNQLSASWFSVMAANIAMVDVHSVPQLRLDEIAENKSPQTQTQTIVSWECRRPIRVSIQPASKGVCFAHDKTYWLVGLTGGLGLTLCKWMVERGASDVTERNSVRQTHEVITRTMPPIAGVAQGAMVLHDNLFHDLHIERLDKVLKPKVDGSVYLDEIFSDDTLDFFVYLSSIAYVAGNAGKSAYAAANGFMASLAANRRSRGLAGSVINIGPIIGNGYIARELTEAKQTALYNAGFSFMSEQDFHEIFAEGVLASRPGSSESLELTTGLRVDDSDGWRNWGLNPMFRHLIFKTHDLNPVNSKAKRGASIKAQLSAASSHEQRFEILKVSVDLQSWFRKELGVDIPVLKILNASSVNELLNSAQELLEPETIHSLSSIVTAPQNVDTRRSTGSGTIMDQETVEPHATTSETASAPETDPPTTLLRSNGANMTSNSETAFQRSVPMSFAQSRFWFLKSFVEDQAAFNVTSTAHLKGRLDFNRLGKALVDVGQRHEALRTAFYTDETTKCHMQGVLPTSVLRLEYIPFADAQHVRYAAESVNLMSKGYARLGTTQQYVSSFLKAVSSVRARYHPLLRWTAKYVDADAKDVYKHHQRAADILRPVLQARMDTEAQGIEAEHEDGIQWLMDAYRANGKRPTAEQLALDEMGLAVASIHSSSATLLSTLYDLIDRPDALGEIREEIARVSKESSTWDRSVGIFATSGQLHE
ncbi:hypothetical protein DL769_005554 [Monosporascus sp. CRB-8-3]|nr:hypothetical protein DL769_005554 [Monosporascus sp. CRB-8-3]